MSFEYALQAHGLRPRVISADGKWRRCATDDKPRKKNGAYVLFPDGRGYFKNWAKDFELNRWCDSSVNPSQKFSQTARREHVEADIKARHAAVQAARKRWSESESMRVLHPYLEKKKLSAKGCAGLRVWRDRLLVPVIWKDRLTSIQSITPEGKKLFWPGAPVKSGSFIVGPQNAPITAFCEGLATGLAIYQSMRNVRVVVAFNATNLPLVVKQIRPHGSVVICSDNDHETERRTGVNPGLQKATEAAELIGAGVAYPRGINGTDWADALLEWDGRARRIEMLIQAEARYVS